MIGKECFTIRSDMYNPWLIYTPFRFYKELYLIQGHRQPAMMVVYIEKSNQGNCYFVYSLN